MAPLRDLKRALTVEGDIASDVAFQNDVNALLAAVSELSALGPAREDVPRQTGGETLVADLFPRRARSARR